MRRVYDDARYEEMAEKIMNVVYGIRPAEVSKYSWGDYRAQPNLIRERIKEAVPIKLGRDANTTGIGNNGCYELVYTDGNEEQIFGLLHTTDDMFGSVIVWVSDIDNGRRTESVKILGRKSNSEV